ncbi:MAG: NAD(P)/FAD-dependent oxidoreductase [Myxococcota bacterium]
MSKPVVIVGAGLSGLTCARILTEAGHAVRVFEKDDAIGGRVQTDEIDGFRLDRGFQILLTGYPELRRHLDLDALDLRRFDPGAVLWTGDGFETIGDPLRQPGALLPTVFARSGTVLDKLRVLTLRRDALRGGDYGAFESGDGTTADLLRDWGFSDRFIARFFTPFLGGIFLEPKLETTARFFRFVWRMFATGDATVPARGMGEIPKQLAAGLSGDAITTGCAVTEVTPDGVRLDDGTRVEAAAVIVAGAAPAARALVPSVPEIGERGVTCLYFSADAAPTDKPVLHLDGTGAGPVNNLHVASAVSSDVAPAGRALISATCLGVHDDLDALEARARAQLRAWFGTAVDRWDALRHYPIRHALPAQPVGALEPSRRPVRHDSGVYLCGDYLDQASIDGAMVSGRRVAEAVLADASARATG